MLIAEIRRKLLDLDDIDPRATDALEQVRRLINESEEDLLTADVFGVLKYLPRSPYLGAVVKAIARLNPSATEYRDHLGTLLNSLLETQFRFWPPYSTPAGISDGGTEPDVELSSRLTFMLVEAKLRSGFGALQVERELAVALTQSAGREAFVLLVTPSSIPPSFSHNDKRRDFANHLLATIQDGALSEEAATLLKPNARRVPWISWDAILVAIKQAHRDHCRLDGETDAVARCGEMVADLEVLLGQRGIRPFHGIDQSVSAHDYPTKTRLLLWASGIPADPARSVFVPISRIALNDPLASGWKCPRLKHTAEDHLVSIPQCCAHTPLEQLTPRWRIEGLADHKRNRISISRVVENRPIQYTPFPLLKSATERKHGR